MAYSKDFRKRVITYIEAGHSKCQAGRIFNVAVTTIDDWIVLQHETGSVAKRELHRAPRKYGDEKLRALVEETPDATLSELAAEFEGGTITGVAKALKKLKITRKKNDNLQGAR
jgi:transposase